MVCDDCDDQKRVSVKKSPSLPNKHRQNFDFFGIKDDF